MSGSRAAWIAQNLKASVRRAVEVEGVVRLQPLYALRRGMRRATLDLRIRLCRVSQPLVQRRGPQPFERPHERYEIPTVAFFGG